MVAEQIKDTDKVFWHRYIDTYEAALATLGTPANIMEFGIADGYSIRWLQRRFPGATIVGVDIDAEKEIWPKADNIRYVQLDQNDRGGVRAMFADLTRPFDLIIEDGSHIPQHQANCLLEGLPWVRSGGVYILEDIHTNHPDHDFHKIFCRHDGRSVGNCLNALLAIRHLLDTGKDFSAAAADKIARNSFFSVQDVRFLFERIADVQIFKRSTLPLRCYACGGDDFDYVNFRCSCGVELYKNADSMTCVITCR